ncbi:MAG: cell envelope integrity protein TolA [Ferrovum sp.]|jgi:colicin import membrane protein|nr:cell envelope integrity protein TolA [Ferrovum sp.]NDU90140.1 cell envelope integrity protein TolA [Ferrovum sp.]
MLATIDHERGVRLWAWLLALLVHALFVAILVFGVSWQRHPDPAPLMAELWSDIPKPATVTEVTPPQPVTPEPQAQPVPAPTLAPPRVETASAPTHPEPKPALPATPSAADIALKKKKEKATQEAKRQADQQQREKMLAEQLRQERQDALKEERRDAALRADAEVRRRQAEQLAQNARAAQAAAVDRYKLAIINKIRGNTEVPEGVQAGLTLEVDVTILPDGGVLEPVRIVKSSGDPRYDQAVLRGILRSQPLPLPSDVVLRRLFRVTHLQIHHEK